MSSLGVFHPLEKNYYIPCAEAAALLAVSCLLQSNCMHPRAKSSLNSAFLLMSTCSPSLLNCLWVSVQSLQDYNLPVLTGFRDLANSPSPAFSDSTCANACQVFHWHFHWKNEQFNTGSGEVSIKRNEREDVIFFFCVPPFLNAEESVNCGNLFWEHFSKIVGFRQQVCLPYSVSIGSVFIFHIIFWRC